MKRVFYNLLLSLLAIGLPLCAMDAPQEQNKPQLSIEDYRVKDHHNFVVGLLAPDTYNFPDADMAPNLDSETLEIKVQLGGGHITRSYKQKIFICTREAQAIGFLRIFDLGNNLSSVAQLAVKEDARRIGAGRLLLEHAIAYSKTNGVKEIVVESMKNSTGAHALYQKTGFQFDGRLADSYLYRMKIG